jgi:putative mRNA 3-end processing factor
MQPPRDDLVVERPQGLYCPAGDFYIDPMRPVVRAVITHAHADHARSGHGHILATAISEGVLRARLGAASVIQGLAYGEVVSHQGVRISLHPAGHVLGSAQVRLEHRGRVWVVSGDYFLSSRDERNPTCEAFEPQRCDCFITESTFALPIYRWQPQALVFAEINAWWQANAQAGRASVMLAYSLGKAQRLIAGVDPAIGAIVVHPAVEVINAAYRAAGVALPPTRAPVAAAADAASLAGALVITPPGAHFALPADAALAFASGWTQVRGARQRPGQRGFVLSDHADWPGLVRAISATGAQRVIVTHGMQAALVRYLSERGVDAGVFRTRRDGDEADEARIAAAALSATSAGVLPGDRPGDSLSLFDDAPLWSPSPPSA